MMKLEINITKGKFWTLTTLLVLAISVFVFAATDKPNPGHSAGEVEGLTDLINRVNTLETDGGWLKNNYCILRSGDSCPEGFNSGSICVDTEDTNNEDKNNGQIGASHGGEPRCTGQEGNGAVTLEFCCKNS